MFQMLSVFAEFERGIIRERVNAGLARARAKGTKLGRRRVDPNVWSGRALQEVSSPRQMRSCINVSGLWLELVVLRAIMDISAHAI
jgi:hypothetical protein